MWRPSGETSALRAWLRTSVVESVDRSSRRRAILTPAGLLSLTMAVNSVYRRPESSGNQGGRAQLDSGIPVG